MITSLYPDLAGARTNEERISLLYDAYISLRREIEFNLSNLDASNMSTRYNLTIEDIENTAGSAAEGVDTLTAMLYDEDTGDIVLLQAADTGLSARIQTNSGNIATLTATAEGLSTRLTTAEGNISTITQTVNGISTTVSTHTGQISTLTQTANSLSSRVTTAEGNISTLTQTANSLTSRITTAEGNISTLTQTVNSISTTVSDAVMKSSATQTAAGFTLTIKDGSTTRAVLDKNGISIYEGGFRIYKGTTQVFEVTSQGAINMKGNLTSGSSITAATISGATITGGTISGTTFNAITLTSSTITGGTISGAQIMSATIKDGETSKVVMGSDGLSIYNAGLKIYDAGNNGLLYFSSGNLCVKGKIVAGSSIESSAISASTITGTTITGSSIETQGTTISGKPYLLRMSTTKLEAGYYNGTTFVPNGASIISNSGNNAELAFYWDGIKTATIKQSNLNFEICDLKTGYTSILLNGWVTLSKDIYTDNNHTTRMFARNAQGNFYQGDYIGLAVDPGSNRLMLYNYKADGNIRGVWACNIMLIA